MKKVGVLFGWRRKKRRVLARRFFLVLRRFAARVFRIHVSQASVKEQARDALTGLDELRRVREEKRGELEEKMDHVVAGA